MTLPGDPYDLLIVGGGVNGTAIARAAAVAGQRVLLVEADDLAAATSSASTKLMHGGLRYLEYYEFKLVAEALDEREVMLRTAPHLVSPLEFRVPYTHAVRPWVMVRVGLWLYDWFARKGSLPRSRGVRLDDPAMRQGCGRAFSYWDGWVDDARLTVMNARDAADAGAVIATRTRLVRAERGADVWTAALECGGVAQTVTARIIVNAAGPWVDRVRREALGQPGPDRTRLVRGSHIIVPRCFGGDHALLLQQPDRRVVFAIPYLDRFTLIGTTDVTVAAAEDTAISDDERAYLLAAANLYLKAPLADSDVTATYGGVRPLFDDGRASASAVSRDYHLECDEKRARVLTVYGGKITTARHLADDALAMLGIAAGATRNRPLPGGDMADFSTFLTEVRACWPWLGDALSLRLARAYGSRIAAMLDDAASLADLGQDFGAGLTAREVTFLVSTEWAQTADDVLWRRTKLGYDLTETQVAAVTAFLSK